MQMAIPRKRYVGDGVYVDYDPEREMIVITTEDGLQATNTIYFEEETLTNTLKWVDEFLAAVRAVRAKQGKVV